ncbi:SDR family NAD(P)-dependent oxidoreductase [Saccharothrix syringae]|uniref:SDR family NAD(P)-dependent oxidoreductase n=1 Tax=Saccharothrix syringae TaxID=103733 RepID=A0A5Q0GYW9_SACSY|nr:SDR family NAD(P)-dependent oxidoreductase [Saccharothrix syringae]QFZ19149.1 SDR family NAD(P)-dependent oxidoreductase [Saccharothrix syringae]
MNASENAPRPLAVVTGASSGIGLELARVFVEQGFDLVIAAENPTIEQAAQDLTTDNAQVTPVRADLSTYSGNEDLVAVIEHLNRPVAALAINAGVGVGGDFVDDSDLRTHLQVVDLNIGSAVHLAKRLIPRMVERGEGRVLFTSSVAATGPGPFHSVYAASKAFLASFSQSLREELRDSGVTVTALMPGPTDTDFFRRAGMEDTKVATGPRDDPAEVAREGYEALMAGKDHVVAGSLRNKAQAAAGRALPDPVKAKAMRTMTEPGSGKS